MFTRVSRRVIAGSSVLWVFSILAGCGPAPQDPPEQLKLPVTAAANSVPGREEDELRQMVGKVVVGKVYPAGWKWEGDYLIGGCEECRHIGMTTLSRNGRFALVLDKTLDRGSQDKPGRYLILGALYLGQVPRESTSLGSAFIGCRVDPALSREVLPYQNGYKIIADAKFDIDDKTCRCQRLSREVMRAWHVDIVKGRFTPIAAKGVVCENILCSDGFMQSCH